MALALNVVSPDTSHSSAASSLTSGTFTVSGTDKALIGFVLSGDGSPVAPSSVKWRGSGGTSLSQVGTTQSVGTFYRLSVWQLVAPTDATDTFYTAWGGTQNVAITGATQYTGADQASPVDTSSLTVNTGSLSGTSGTATVTVPSISGQLVLAVVAVANPNTGTNPLMDPGSHTNVYDVEGSGNAGGLMAMQVVSQVASGSSTVLSVGISGAESGAPWTMIGFVVKAAGAGPSIASTGASSAAPGDSLIITGTTFGATQGGGGVTVGGVSQTVTSWSDTSITVTVVRGTNKYGAALNVVVTDSSAQASSPYSLTGGLVPASGWSYVTVGTPNPLLYNRLSATPDIANGDQLSWENLGGNVSVFPDGIFWTSNSVYRFQFEVWTTDGWGSLATQEIFEPQSPAGTNDAAEVESARFLSLLDVRTWAAPLNIGKWVADEFSSAAADPVLAVIATEQNDQGISAVGTFISLSETTQETADAFSGSIQAIIVLNHSHSGQSDTQASTVANLLNSTVNAAEVSDATTEAVGVSISATESTTEQVDLLTLASSSVASVDLSVFELADDLVSSSPATVGAGVSAVEKDDAQTGSLSVAIAANESIIEQIDALDGLTTGSSSANLILQETPDQLGSSVTLPISLIETVIEQGDALSGIAASLVVINCATAEQSDGTSALLAALVNINHSIVEAADAVASTITAADTITVVLSAFEQNDSIAAIIQGLLSASALMTEDRDDLLSTALVSLSVSAQAVEQGDQGDSVISSAPVINLVIVEQTDTPLVSTSALLNAIAQINEQTDQLVISTTSSRVTTLIVTEQSDPLQTSVLRDLSLSLQSVEQRDIGVSRIVMVVYVDESINFSNVIGLPARKNIIYVRRK